MAIADTPATIVTPAVVPEAGSYVDWPAIFAGTVLATTISFVLLTFGSAIGLSLTSAYEGEGMSLFWFAIAAALWVLWVQISSFIAGGYLTGRLRRRHGDASEHESDIRDGSHGLVVWGLGVLLGAFIVISGATNVVSTTVSAAGNAAGAVVEAASGPGELLVDRFMRTPAGAPAADPADTAAFREEAGRLLTAAVSDEGLTDADRQYLVQRVAARTGVDEATAQQTVDQVIQQAQAAEQQVRDAAERARKIGMVAAFIAAASLLVSAAGAYWGATLGGNHRDKQTFFPEWSRRL